MIGDLFQHFKGGVYRVIDAPTDCESGKPVRVVGYFDEVVVWYQSLKDGKIWVRSLREWSGTVEKDGFTIPRFKKISE